MTTPETFKEEKEFKEFAETIFKALETFVANQNVEITTDGGMLDFICAFFQGSLAQCAIVYAEHQKAQAGKDIVVDYRPLVFALHTLFKEFVVINLIPDTTDETIN